MRVSAQGVLGSAPRGGSSSSLSLVWVSALPQALRVLDVSRRPAVTDELLHHLAAHPPANLHTLDVSLTVRGPPDQPHYLFA